MNVDTFTYAWIGLAAATFILLQYVDAPFGRHTRKDFGPSVPNHIGWIIMEFPSLLMVNLLFWTQVENVNWLNLSLLSLWSLHYINRSFIYPLRQKDKSKTMPLAVTGSAVFFNLVNGSLNGYYLSQTTPESIIWPVYAIGAVLFVVGAGINISADNYLLSLRKPGDKQYVIPKNSLFSKVSCPNLMGEMIEWIGFAMMAQNLGALSFAIWTFANLAPRAKAHHEWYKEKFPEYPKKRKAVIPYIF